MLPYFPYSLFHLYAICITCTKHSAPRAGMSLREMLATIPTASSRALTQKFCLGEEQTVKQMAPKLFTKELTSFATEHGEV